MSSSSNLTPVYFETSWSVLSTLSLFNILFGITVIRLTTLSPISIVPVVISTASALANGLCYIVYYSDYSKASISVAAVFGEFALLVQEAGTLFYSYLILTQLLHCRPRLIYISLFWSILSITLILRLSILICRAHDILTFQGPTTNPLERAATNLHVPYYILLASTELLSAIFLLRKLSSARRTSLMFTKNCTLFNYLMRSTQLRLSILGTIWIGRAILFGIMGRDGQSTRFDQELEARSWTRSADRFLYVGECLFPVAWFIDILASKLVLTNQQNPSTPTRSPDLAHLPNQKAHNPHISLYPNHESYLTSPTSPGGDQEPLHQNQLQHEHEHGHERAESDPERQFIIAREQEREMESYTISQDVVDVTDAFSMIHDFEFLVGRVDPCPGL